MKRSIHVAAWVLLAVAAFLLLPERWGGSMTYVITNGNSMGPQWQAGDLAVLRAADDYRVGDVAAFRSDDIKNTVMHRIIDEDEEAGTYRFKGDNNKDVDSEVVREEQMLGKLVLRVPGVGKYLNVILQPINLLLIVASIAAFLNDRKKSKALKGGRRESDKPALGRLTLRSLSLPPATVTAELLDEADLDRVAAHLDRPVLEVQGESRRYVVDGAVLYTWTEPVQLPRQRERRATPQGRDWADTSSRHLQAVADEQQVS